MFTVRTLLGIGFGGLKRWAAQSAMPGVVASVAEDLVAIGTNGLALIIVVVTGSFASKMTSQD